MFCIMPPKRLWTPFVRIKSRHFAAKLKKRGKSPFPHITLAQARTDLLSYASLASVAIQLSKAIRANKLAAFKVNMDDMDVFTHGKRATIFVRDSSAQAKDAITRLHRIVVAATSSAPAFGAFTPHVAIANVSQSVSAGLLAQYKASWSSVSFWACHVHVLVTDTSGPWRVVQAIGLHDTDGPADPEVGGLTRLETSEKEGMRPC